MNPTTPSESGYSLVNGLNMYYEIYGAGKPLVLIHGGGSTIQTSFGRIIPLLAKSCMVIGVELQAHGRTADRDQPTSFAGDAADVVALLGNLNIEKADFFGFSNGGQTALQIAMTYPDKVNKLIVASAFYKKAGAPDWFWEGMKNAQFSDMPQPYKDAFLELNNDPEALMAMFTRDAARMQNFRDWSDEDIRSITAPVLFIQGDKDLPTIEHIAEMSGLVKNSQVAVIPGTHGTYMGELTTLNNGVWEQAYLLPLFTQFLD